MASLSNEDHPFFTKRAIKAKKKQVEPRVFVFPDKPPASEYTLEIIGLCIAFVVTLFIVFALPILFGF